MADPGCAESHAHHAPAWLRPALSRHASSSTVAASRGKVDSEVDNPRFEGVIDSLPRARDELPKSVKISARRGKGNEVHDPPSRGVQRNAALLDVTLAARPSCDTPQSRITSRLSRDGRCKASGKIWNYANACAPDFLSTTSSRRERLAIVFSQAAPKRVSRAFSFSRSRAANRAWRKGGAMTFSASISSMP